MMKAKLKWKVSPALGGKYNPLHKRPWPTATFLDGFPAAMIVSSSGYVSSNVLTGAHGALEVHLADYSEPNHNWIALDQQFALLSEAKLGAELYFEQHPEILPKSMRDPA